MAVDATGRFLYLQNYVQGQAYGFSVDQVSGALTPLSGSPFASGVNAYAVAIDASNRFLYVGSQDGTSAVVALAIHQTTGALTAVPGSPFAGPAVQALVTTGAGAASSATLVSVALQPSPLTITTSQLGWDDAAAADRHLQRRDDAVADRVGELDLVAHHGGARQHQTGTKGRATTHGYGTTTITATYSGQTATGTLTVTQPAIASLVVTPSSPTIASGTAIQFTAVVTYVDGSTQTITTLATWASSNTAAATVSNASGSQGLTTAIAPGTSTITATYNGVTGRRR